LAVQPGSVVFFAVELTKIRENMMDGPGAQRSERLTSNELLFLGTANCLTVGITTNSPGDLDEMPDTIDGVQAERFRCMG
ncbi:unnamed protein product, partial [Effrenium voratum]